MNKAPIEIDSLIKRYLHDIEFNYDSSNQEGITERSVPKGFVLVSRLNEADGEHLGYHAEINFDNFVKYFEESKSLSFYSYGKHLREMGQDTDPESWNVSFEMSDPYQQVSYEKSLYIEVLDIDFIRSFRRDYLGVGISTSNNNTPIVFIDEESKIPRLVRGDIYEDLESGSQEHYLCRALFDVAPNTLVPLDEIIEKIHGGRSLNNIKKDKKSISDTRNRLNDKIRLKFGEEDYFEPANGNIIRRK